MLIYQKRGKGKRKEPLHSIQVRYVFERIEIDLVGPLSITTQNNWYIIVATDYLTKWSEARAVFDARTNTLQNSYLKKLSVNIELLR